MTEKFTLRDILVYTLLGLITIYFYYLYSSDEITNIILCSKEYSDLTILLLIPFSYLIGHLLMSLDDLIFNFLLLRIFPKENPLKNIWLKSFNFLFFGYRNIGIRNQEGITNKDFLNTCDKLIAIDRYAKAEYYQVMSDLFKGIFLIITLSIVIDLSNKTVTIWKLIALFLVWFRARMFSSYYVRMIVRKFSEI